jgi:alkylation response protein AidB-like acyl-CoA dehydrogenase
VTELLHRVNAFLEANPVAETEDRVLRERRFDAGLAFVALPPGLGGLGADPTLQGAVDERFRNAGAREWRNANFIGLGMAAPTISTHGTAEQQQLLRPLFTGEHVWCQLFSEPGAGSDLAGVASSAQRDGDDWIINGQKVWTTLGHVARYGLLLTRSNVEAPKHRGLTYFLLDMRLDGVVVRPLRQMTGDAEFNEVYLTDVRVPDSARIGPVDGGWAVAMTTLSNERNALGATAGEPGSGPIGQALDLLRALDPADPARVDLLDRCMELYVRAEASRLFNAELAHQAQADARGSLAKLQMAELNQAIYDLCMEILGVDGLLYDSSEQSAPQAADIHGGSEVQRGYLRTMANSIEGGTSEIQRTIVAERILALPPEPRVDKDRPFRDVPRS